MATRKGPRSKSKHLLATLVTGEKAPCAFCQRSVDDEITYGKLYAIGDIQCHYFCVLLSCCLIQKGQDEEGLFGFLYADILVEIERSKKHRCSYCLKDGATLGCSISQCRKQFHLPCGRERDAVSLFYGNYKSFCQLHAPKQKIPEHIMTPARMRMRQAKTRKLKPRKTLGNLNELCTENPSEETDKKDTESVCVICYEEVDGFPTLQTFWPPCCARDAWFHRTCLQRMALSAGMHYLKCPLCNEKEHFYEAVVSQGYYVPDRDAAWELEQNAFAEIYERPLSCGADECLCPAGRRHDDADTGEWDIKLCILCGTSGVHAQCLPAGAGATGARFVCGTCSPAAPHDLEQLAASIEAVILSEQAAESAGGARRGIVMPSRMSLRRTKQRLAHNAPSTSKTDATVKTQIEGQSEAEKSGKVSKPDTPTSRLELNLKTPKRPTKTQERPKLEPTVLRDIDNILLSPLKLLEQGMNEKIQRMGVKEIELDSSTVLERIREQFKKPRPLSEKKRIINDILESLFDNVFMENPKTKEPIKEWSTPKKCGHVKIEVDEESIQENTDPTQETIKQEFPDKDITRTPEKKLVPLQNSNKFSETELEPLKIEDKRPKKEDFSEKVVENTQSITENMEPLKNTEEYNMDSENKEETCHKGSLVEDHSSNSTVELPSEFIADHISDDSLTLFETPKKLKTVDIQKDSSLEISANDEVVNVDIIKMDSDPDAECNLIKSIKIKTPDTKKCPFKFSPLDMESFKNQYLNEVDKEFKCSYSHKHKHNHSVSSPKKIRTAIDFALEAYNKERNNETSKENNLKRKSNTMDNVENKRKKKEIKGSKLIYPGDESQNNAKRTIDIALEEKKEATKKRKKLKKLKKMSMRGIDLALDATEGKKLKKMSVSEINLNLCTTEKKDSERKRKKIKKNKREIQVKIRWKKEQLKLKITESESKKIKKQKNSLKQYILKCSPEMMSNTLIVKPDRDVTLKRKYIKQEKSPDNLKQTSIQSYFKMKPPEKPFSENRTEVIKSE